MSNKFKSTIIAALLGLSAIISGCTAQSFAAPPASLPMLVPQIDVYQLQLDYSQDIGVANNLYAGKRFYFGTVRADYVSSIFDVRGSEDFVIVNNIKFKPRASADMRGIIQGTVFEVIGDVQGVQSNYVVVTNCWFRVQSGGSAYTGGGAY